MAILTKLVNAKRWVLDPHDRGLKCFMTIGVMALKREDWRSNVGI